MTFITSTLKSVFDGDADMEVGVGVLARTLDSPTVAAGSTEAVVQRHISLVFDPVTRFSLSLSSFSSEREGESSTADGRRTL